MFEPTVRAPGYSILLGKTRCHACQAETRTAAIWVGKFEDLDEQAMDPNGAALLTFVEDIDTRALATCQEHLPRLRMAFTKMSGTTYLANHCEVCGTVLGDHFVHGPDGPFWPAGEEQLAAGVRKIDFPVPICAVASLSQATWIDQMVHWPRSEPKP